MDLQPFCSVDEMRGSIMTPWVFNGWKYATDGRICVRIPTDEPNDSNEPYKRPDAAQLFMTFNVDIDGLDAFKIPTLEGVKIIECDSCNGDGYAICDMGHDHECPNCDGDGSYEEWPKKEIGGQTFSERYLSKITNLPGLQFFAQSADIESLKPALFTFNNGQGLLMPIRKETNQ